MTSVSRGLDGSRVFCIHSERERPRPPQGRRAPAAIAAVGAVLMRPPASTLSRAGMVVRGSIIVALALASACWSRCIMFLTGASPLDGAAGRAIPSALHWLRQHVGGQARAPLDGLPVKARSLAGR